MDTETAYHTIESVIETKDPQTDKRYTCSGKFDDLVSEAHADLDVFGKPVFNDSCMQSVKALGLLLTMMQWRLSTLTYDAADSSQLNSQRQNYWSADCITIRIRYFRVWPGKIWPRLA